MKSLSLNLLLILAFAALAGCTWVEPDAGGSRVQVAYNANLDHCTRLGEVTTSVAHRVAGVERNETKVRDELESLARNEAVSLGADTIQAVTQPADGSQRFAAYRCN